MKDLGKFSVVGLLVAALMFVSVPVVAGGPGPQNCGNERHLRDQRIRAEARAEIYRNEFRQSQQDLMNAKRQEGSLNQSHHNNMNDVRQELSNVRRDLQQAKRDLQQAKNTAATNHAKWQGAERRIDALDKAAKVIQQNNMQFVNDRRNLIVGQQNFLSNIRNALIQGNNPDLQKALKLIDENKLLLGNELQKKQ